jgi:hypothetical protein
MNAKETPTREGAKTAKTTKKAANPKRGVAKTAKTTKKAANRGAIDT